MKEIPAKSTQLPGVTPPSLNPDRILGEPEIKKHKKNEPTCSSGESKGEDKPIDLSMDALIPTTICSGMLQINTLC